MCANAWVRRTCSSAPSRAFFTSSIVFRSMCFSTLGNTSSEPAKPTSSSSEGVCVS